MVIEIALSALLFARESPHVPALQLFPRSIKTWYTYTYIYMNLVRSNFCHGRSNPIQDKFVKFDEASILARFKIIEIRNSRLDLFFIRN